MIRTLICFICILVLPACAGAAVQPSPVLTSAASPSPISTTGGSAPAATASAEPALAATVPLTLPACPPPPIVVPTAAPDPGYTELDPTTGLHMTGRATQIDLATYRLKITGKVDHPLSLSYDDLRCMPKREVKATLICPGYFEDVATWAGVPLLYVLDQAGLQPDAKSITMKGADGYSGFVLLRDIQYEDNLIAYEWKGQPVPVLHGFPVRMVFPGLSGGHWAKWLLEIVVE